MKYFFPRIVVFALICLPFSADGQSPTNSQKQIVDQVIEKLALSYRIAGLPANLAKQFEQNPFRLPEQINQKWLASFSKAYTKDAMMKDYITLLKNQLSGISVEALQQWLNKPSTQKLAKARQEHYSLQGKRKQIVALYELEQDPPSSARQKLLAKFAEVMIPAEELTEATVTVFKSVINSVDEVSSQLNFTETQMSTLVSNFKQQEPLNIQQMKENGLPVKFYGIPAPTIEQSLSFWQSDTGQALQKAIYASMKQTYEKAAQRLAESVAGTNQ